MRALILAGGSGTRFWPLSRQGRPKQLVALGGDGRSLLRATIDRLGALVAPEDVWVCTTQALAAAVRAELPNVPAQQILAEPVGRNTAPAIAWAVATIGGDDPVVVLPADHLVGDEIIFRGALARAAEVAATGVVVTIGVRPRWAETGYGYLELAANEREPGVASVVRFTEKPDAATARRFVDSGNYLWNAGIFVLRPSVLAAAVAQHLPELAAGLAAVAAAKAKNEDIDGPWATLPAVSIDHGIMERLADIAVVPFDGGWSDLGSWDALHEVLPQSAEANATVGDALLLGDSRRTLVWADDGVTVACIGVEDLVVVATGDAVLVVPRSRCQDVREVVAQLVARGDTSRT